MDLSFLTDLFKKKKKSPPLISNSHIVDKLKPITLSNDLYLYENVTIYHHKQSFFIPLIILDTSRGIYLFEYKQWNFDELKDVEIKKAHGAESEENTLAYEKAHDIIRQKFNEITHNDGVPIYNYLLMENLTTNEYGNLHADFHQLLPADKLIFSDTTHADILRKLHSASGVLQNLPNASNIIGTLLIQYAILKSDMELKLCTQDQIAFIDSNISEHISLNGPAASGKTSTVLLKSILEKLKNPALKIIIIKPTLLSCEILKKQLLDIVEHAIVEIDLTSIEIITPHEFLNKHQGSSNFANRVDPALLKRKLFYADLVICDDADYYFNDFVSYLKHTQEKHSLIIVGDSQESINFSLEKSYRLGKQVVEFHQTNPLAKAMHLISKLLKENKAQDILVVSNNLSREKLNEDLESFIKDKAILLDSSVSLINQDMDNLLLSTYSDIHGIDAKHIILMDVCDTDEKELNYAFELSKDTISVLYVEECQQILNLKEKYENYKN